MKNIILGLSLSLAIGTILTLNSCKKETTEDDSISAQDAATVNSAVNATSDDAGAVAGQVTGFAGKTQGLYQALCGISLIDSTTTAGRLTITYDGLSYCLRILRSGSIR